MSNILWSILAGGMAGLAACLALLRFNLVPATRSAGIGAGSLEPDVLPETPVPSEAPTAGAAPAPDMIAAILPPLGKVLAPLAEEVGHPRQLLDMPEFNAVLAAFRRPDATLPLLGQYALGANWPLACAAFLVLAERPERQSLCDPVLRHLATMRPYVLMYALRFLTSLEQRPPLGAVILAAQQWWQNNPVIPGFIQDYFAHSAELGDQPDFGTYLDGKAERDSVAIVGLLQKIQHSFATQLLAAWRNWQDTRVDRTFLSSVGTLWDPAERDPLLVLPEAWRDALAAAETAVGQLRPRSVLVCGDPRIGKTAFIELLGSRLQQEGWTVFAASGNELMADQMYIGQLEGRIRKVVDALHARRKLIWYVRDLGQMANSGTHQGQSASILDQILPAIAAGTLIIIGESSQAAATRLFQTRPSLRSLMEVLPLQPMDEAETSALAMEIGSRLTEQSGLGVPEQAIAAAMDLAQHYLGTGHLPGAVLELLKRAANRSIAAGETTLTAESVVATLSQISGLPSVILDTSQRVDLAQVRDFFSRRVIGQDEAVKAMVDRIAMLKAGLTDPGRPIGVFLFAGPTGTGKTELAKTLADFLFGSAERMARLDMSEFQTIDATSKILGHRGDSGVESLIDRIRKQPFSVILLDEFEKAHPNCWDLFLQIFDDGRLTDANGKEADFRHCIIILTSNLGATAHRGGGLGFRPDPGVFVDEQVLRTIGQTFRPEFVNRLDKVIVFKPLSRDLMRGILHKELAHIQERRGLRERAWAVEWEASAIEFLLDRGFSPEMGARPLKRAIDQLLLAPLAATLVEHRFPEGDQFLFVRSNGKEIEVEFVDPDAEPAEHAPVEPETEGSLSLPAIILRQTGTRAERASLTGHWREVDGTLASESWRAKIDQLRLAFADPSIWLRADRHRVFSGLELADRIGEAARTAERLFQRYDRTSEHTDRASRELAGRLALQLHNLRQGIDDLAADTPIDALLRVEPALDTGTDGHGAVELWCRRLTGMYRQWAQKRRMQIKEIPPADGKGMPILQITGFGAFRTLSPEAGLHVLEEDQGPDSARRIVARIIMVSGPDRELSVSGEFAGAAQLLAAVPTSASIVRRYREEPTPLVRDILGGWRSGRLAAILAGDFDLIGDIKRRQSGS
ncbi:MAG TPA: AAA family ATPase [Aliidongia sp.]|nr:AAA family ATPase [Aliidongia sp.]